MTTRGCVDTSQERNMLREWRGSGEAVGKSWNWLTLLKTKVFVSEVLSALGSCRNTCWILPQRVGEFVLCTGTLIRRKRKRERNK
eukprot:553660-Rhodomonas_salina.2